MNHADQQKLLNAGFTLLRRYRHRLMIRVIHPGEKPGHWALYEKGFRSIEALNKRMEELLQDEMVIEESINP